MKNLKRYFKKNLADIIALIISILVLIGLLTWVGANAQRPRSLRDTTVKTEQSYSMDSTYKVKISVKRNTDEKRSRAMYYFNGILIIVIGVILLLWKA